MQLDNDDNDTTASGNIYKGVELYPGANDGSTVGMFGMDFTAAAATDLCLHAAIATPGKRICSTYSNYVDYTDAQTDSAGEK